MRGGGAEDLLLIRLLKRSKLAERFSLGSKYPQLVLMKVPVKHGRRQVLLSK